MHFASYCILETLPPAFPTDELLLQMMKIKHQNCNCFFLSPHQTYCWVALKSIWCPFLKRQVVSAAAWLLITLLLALEQNAAAITITVMADTSGTILVIRVRLWLTLMEMQTHTHTHTHTYGSCNLAKWMLHCCATLSHLLPSLYLHYSQDHKSVWDIRH